MYILIILAKEKAAQEKAAKEEEAEEEAEANKKRHLNAVFIGHVGMSIWLLNYFHQCTSIIDTSRVFSKLVPGCLCITALKSGLELLVFVCVLSFLILR